MNFGIGHNGGPSLAAGAGFRRVAWSRARAQMLPSLPLEVVRLRVARAKRLGLPYKTYASIRAASGRDVVAFLFSDNALGMDRRGVVPSGACQRLEDLEGGAARIGAVHAPLSPGAVLARGGFEVVDRAPGLMRAWAAARADLRGMARAAHVPVDGVVVVAATALEDQWCGTAGFAGVVRAEAIGLHGGWSKG